MPVSYIPPSPPPPGIPPQPRRRVPFSGPDRNLWATLALGLAVITVWYAATRTTLVYAYKIGSLSQAQGLCDSSLGRFSQNMSAVGAAICAHIDSLSMWLNLAGFAGLMTAATSVLLLAYRAQRRVR